jgi:4-oxalomesaconate tautomerase
VVPTESRIDYAPTCGNILAAVGPFAIAKGWLAASGDETPVRIFMVNTQARCTATVPTADGAVTYAGTTRISGVPGTAAPIFLRFADILGSSCGRLFPTGRHRDRILDTDVTCIDHGMPVVLIRASDCGITGYEPPAELDANAALKARIEVIRLVAGKRMGLGDVSDKVIPKVTLVAAPREGGMCCTRTFIPHRCHEAIGVLGAVSVATAGLYPDTVTSIFCVAPSTAVTDLVVEHPTGEFGVRLFRDGASGELTSAALMRTARALFEGRVWVPSNLVADPVLR